MTQFGRWGGAWAVSQGVGILVAGIVMLAPGISRALAGHVETRDFTITVDGKRGGQYHMTITQQDAGTVILSAQADVKLTFAGFVKYAYSYRGVEIWKDGVLNRLNSNCNDNGKRFSVAAVGNGKSLQVQVNGQEHASPANVWTTTYWRLPAQRPTGQAAVALPLLDADTGKDMNATLQYLGTSQVGVAGQLQNCAHYRVTGPVQVDVWYDDQDRLVRQESLEEGNHRTILTLAQIQR